MGIAKRLFQRAISAHVWLYRASGGRLGSMGGTVVLLTTLGARTGLKRTVPLMGLPHEEGWIVVASAGGDVNNPGWYHNLLANPGVELQKGSHTALMDARVAGPDERPTLWAKVIDANPRFARYETRTEREIPLVILEPMESGISTH